MPHAGGRAGGDQVARRERDQVGEVRDEVGHVEDQLRGAAVLHLLAVDPGPELQDVRVRHFLAIGEAGPERREGLAHLALRPLARHELEVAGAHVVDDRIAEDVVEGPLPGDVARRAPDDDAELDLPVELLAAPRPEDRLARVEDRVAPLREHGRLRRHRHARLLGVVPVVEADADDLAGVGDRGVQAEGVERRLRPLGDRPDRVEGGGAGFEERPRARREQGGGDGLGAADSLAGERGGVARREVGNLVAPQNAEPRRLTVLGEADESHGGLLGCDGCARIIPRLFRAFRRGVVC